MKKYLLGSIAIVLALFFSAFTFKSPNPDGLVYFEIMEGGFVDTDGGIENVAAFGCDGTEEDDLCAKGFDPARTTVVTQNGPNTWTILNPSASPDDRKYREE